MSAASKASNQSTWCRVLDRRSECFTSAMMLPFTFVLTPSLLRRIFFERICFGSAREHRRKYRTWTKVSVDSFCCLSNFGRTALKRTFLRRKKPSPLVSFFFFSSSFLLLYSNSVMRNFHNYKVRLTAIIVESLLFSIAMLRA